MFVNFLTLEDTTVCPERLILKIWGTIMLLVSSKKVIEPKISVAPTLFKVVKIGAVAVTLLPYALKAELIMTRLTISEF